MERTRAHSARERGYTDDRQIAGRLEARTATHRYDLASLRRRAGLLEQGRRLASPAESPLAPKAPSKRDSVPRTHTCTPTDYCVALGTYASRDDMLQTMVSTYGSLGP
jgi:hypothetical protein